MLGGIPRKNDMIKSEGPTLKMGILSPTPDPQGYSDSSLMVPYEAYIPKNVIPCMCSRMQLWEYGTFHIL